MKPLTPRAIDAQGVDDGAYALAVAGGKVTGLVPSGAGGSSTTQPADIERVGFQGGQNQATNTITVPAGVEPTDVVVLVTSSDTNEPVTGPAGWTQLYTVSGTGNYGNRLHVLAHTGLTAGDTFTFTTSGGSYRGVHSITYLRGVDGLPAYVDQASNRTASTNSTAAIPAQVLGDGEVGLLAMALTAQPPNAVTLPGHYRDATTHADSTFRSLSALTDTGAAGDATWSGGANWSLAIFRLAPLMVEVASDLNSLSDVDTTTTPPSGGQALVYDTALSLWVPGTPTFNAGTETQEATPEVSYTATGETTTSGAAIAWTPASAAEGDWAILIISGDGAPNVGTSWTQRASGDASGYYGHTSRVYSKQVTAEDLDAESLVSGSACRWTVHYLRGVANIVSLTMVENRAFQAVTPSYVIPGGTAPRFVGVWGTSLGSFATDFPLPYVDDNGGITNIGGAFYWHRQGFVAEDVSDVTVSTGTTVDTAAFVAVLTPAQVEVPIPLGLDSMSDVDTTTAAPQDGDTLVYQASTGLWIPGANGVLLLAAGGSVPPETRAGTIVFEQGAPGSTNSGAALGWWDGTTIQPLG